MIGKTLGRYKILEPLGAGGMGEVYLAEDTRLKRKVAIKVLPTEFASDSERLARFEQEARAAAALNHPHIAVVFDVGQELVEVGGGDDGDSDSGDSGPMKSTAVVHYMVQEYLEGQTLADQLNSKGAMPTKKTLDFAAEVAEALGAAPGAGIVHRDLKPANILVSPDGHAKVLDFGLAPAFITGSEGGALPHFPPDGEWIVFDATDTLAKIPAEGGEPLELASYSGPIFGPPERPHGGRGGSRLRPGVRSPTADLRRRHSGPGVGHELRQHPRRPADHVEHRLRRAEQRRTPDVGRGAQLVQGRRAAGATTVRTLFTTSP